MRVVPVFGIDEIVLNPDDVIGTCGLFTVRDFHTSSRSGKQTRYVDVGNQERSDAKVHARKMKRSVVTYICFECCEMSRGCLSSRSS